MLRKILIAILLIPLLNNCGFEVIDRSNIAQFDINQITSSGDRRINYRIKEKLKFAKSENDKKLININLNTEKNKSVKERNIKNEITKYQIEIKINVKLSDIYDKNISNFVVTKSGDYNVEDQYSDTLNNEKKLIKLLSKNLADNIQNEIILRLNAY